MYNQQFSPVYITPPVGFNDQTYFLNFIVKATTNFNVYGFKKLLQSIELESGRMERSNSWGPRTLDIDILNYGQLIVSDKNFQLPHPQLQSMPFVLVPLAELNPNGHCSKSKEPYHERLKKIPLEEYIDYEIDREFTTLIQQQFSS